MQYKIKFNLTTKDNEIERQAFKDFIDAVRDGLYLVDEFLSIYPDYRDDCISFELDLPDCIIEQQKSKHHKFLNLLLKKFWNRTDLFESHLVK